MWSNWNYNHVNCKVLLWMYNVSLKFQLTFLQSWKIAKATDTTNEKKDSWRAFQAFRPRTPIARGMRVIAFNRTNTRIGTMIFLSLALRASPTERAPSLLNLMLRLNSSLSRLRGLTVILESTRGSWKVTSWDWMKFSTLSKKSPVERPVTSFPAPFLVTSTVSEIWKKHIFSSGTIFIPIISDSTDNADLSKRKQV